MNGPFIRYKNFDRSLFCFIKIHAFDRQTDGRTDENLLANTALHSMRRGKNAAAVLVRIYLCLVDQVKTLALINTSRECRTIRHVKRVIKNAPVVSLLLVYYTTSYPTRCSAIAERPRCRVRYSFRQK